LGHRTATKPAPFPRGPNLSIPIANASAATVAHTERSKEKGQSFVM
jgi:hypothetical protein